MAIYLVNYDNDSKIFALGMADADKLIERKPSWVPVGEIKILRGEPDGKPAQFNINNP